ncbi:hypothetical protein [Polaribacter glomeratus]|uniref:Uncharacterized protein n=1 Tax=Polaribacter glomeratus TaxID=102 RepID=A0A2S7WW73_9FLAO|nr:hypothetical protein [Polaribacter glomeratus]PQJ81853.1 hypothetical protein BTO16_04380 [Polaribacter glomeratus]TXD66223.1 hypothetical protein ESX12_05390 [Polaribacter glomeratus]
MQTRDYDDYIYIPSILGFRKVNDIGNEIFVHQETDGYCNIYADNISVSYLHSMNELQINSIHFFEDHHKNIFEVLLAHLSKNFKNPKLELGFRHVNVVDENEICNSEYVFIDSTKKKVKITMHQLKLIN